MIPKYEGTGIMISAFNSREFGFGFYWDDFSDDDLNRINYFGAEKSYKERNAANIIRNGIAVNKYI